MQRARVIASAAGAAALAGVTITLASAPAQASAYRYWTYWQAAPSASTWAYANQGPGTALPQDGAVEGWRFAISSESGSAQAAPTTLPDFTSLCPGPLEEPGMKRIGLVVDPGSPGIAPEGDIALTPLRTCIVIEEDATGYDVLRSVMDVRTENGLVCGIGGYPTRECAPVLTDAEAAALQSIGHGSSSAGLSLDTPGSSLTSVSMGDASVEEGSGSPIPSLTIVALLALGGLQFVWLRRRKRRDG